MSSWVHTETWVRWVCRWCHDLPTWMRVGASVLVLVTAGCAGEPTTQAEMKADWGSYYEEDVEEEEFVEQDIQSSNCGPQGYKVCSASPCSVDGYSFKYTWCNPAGCVNTHWFDESKPTVVSTPIARCVLPGCGATDALGMFRERLPTPTTNREKSASLMFVYGGLYRTDGGLIGWHPKYDYEDVLKDYFRLVAIHNGAWHVVDLDDRGIVGTCLLGGGKAFFVGEARSGERKSAWLACPSLDLSLEETLVTDMNVRFSGCDGDMVAGNETDPSSGAIHPLLWRADGMKLHRIDLPSELTTTGQVLKSVQKLSMDGSEWMGLVMREGLEIVFVSAGTVTRRVALAPIPVTRYGDPANDVTVPKDVMVLSNGVAVAVAGDFSEWGVAILPPAAATWTQLDLLALDDKSTLFGRHTLSRVIARDAETIWVFASSSGDALIGIFGIDGKLRASTRIKDLDLDPHFKRFRSFLTSEDPFELVVFGQVEGGMAGVTDPKYFLHPDQFGNFRCEDAWNCLTCDPSKICLGGKCLD